MMQSDALYYRSIAENVRKPQLSCEGLLRDPSLPVAI
jgi:hypothetical protein